MMGIGIKLKETEKATLYALLSYTGWFKAVWVPKKIETKKRKTVDEIKGTIIKLPHRFVNGHTIAAENFIPDNKKDFTELYSEIEKDIAPTLEEVYIKYTQTIRAPDEVHEFIKLGFVPYKLENSIYFIPKDNIIEYYTPDSTLKTLANTDYIKSAEKPKGWAYKSFVFIVNGKLYEWKENEIFITQDNEDDW